MNKWFKKYSNGLVRAFRNSDNYVESGNFADDLPHQVCAPTNGSDKHITHFDWPEESGRIVRRARAVAVSKLFDEHFRY